VWLGRNGSDCDEDYPGCGDVASSVAEWPNSGTDLIIQPCMNRYSQGRQIRPRLVYSVHVLRRSCTRLYEQQECSGDARQQRVHVFESATSSSERC
jgi:hypothetical protein